MSEIGGTRVTEEAPAKPKKMTAADVREALLKRWPPNDYLTIYEAPETSERGGTKLDLVVLAVWKSRGLTLDGVEVKVSMSDWKRELEGYTDKQGKRHGGPSKADWWYHHVDRFWIAAPADIATKIKPQLPPNWGLLSCTESGGRVLQQATRNPDRTPLSWSTTVGLLRAAADAGPAMLQREHELGRSKGFEEAKRRYEGPSSGVNLDGRVAAVKADLEIEREKIRAFEQTSGLKLGYGTHNAKRLGALVKLVQGAIIQGPVEIVDRMNHQLEQLTGIHQVTERLRDGIVAAFEAEPEPVEPPHPQPLSHVLADQPEDP